MNNENNTKIGYFVCPLCKKQYLKNEYLQEHFRRSPTCKEWADMKLREIGIFTEKQEVKHAESN